jgi:hypothetical protein
MISDKSGRNASNPRLACPPQLKSINTDKVVIAYIPTNKVTESINGLCLKSIRSLLTQFSKTWDA